jgi:hypothetical protein
VCLPGYDFEARVRDSRGDRSTEAWRQDDVELAGQDERRRGDLRKAVFRVVRDADVDLRLEGLDGLLVGEGQRLLDRRSRSAGISPRPNASYPCCTTSAFVRSLMRRYSSPLLAIAPQVSRVEGRQRIPQMSDLC